MIKKLLDYLNMNIIGTEGDEYKCICPVCGTDHLRVNSKSGAWRCLKECAKGNHFTLVRFMTRKEDREIFEILEQCGFDTNDKTTTAVKREPKKLRISQDDIRAATEDELKQLCQVKGLSLDALKKFKPFASTRQPEILIPSYLPVDIQHPCGILRVRIDGQKIKLADGNEDKYPSWWGSTHGLFGLSWLAEQNPSEIIFAEGWQDALTAIEAGFFATATSGGASCFYDGTGETPTILDGKEVIPDWLAFFKDKKVYIVMDEDAAGVGGWITNKTTGIKTCKEGAAVRAANKIHQVAAETRIIRLPFEWCESHGKGLKEFLRGVK